jgi:excinuclease ABC subunit A
MGPEGGSGGGVVVAEGTPEDIAAHPTSYTGVFLAPVLAERPMSRTPKPRAASTTTTHKLPAKKATKKTAASKANPRNAAVTKASTRKTAANNSV